MVSKLPNCLSSLPVYLSIYIYACVYTYIYYSGEENIHKMKKKLCWVWSLVFSVLYLLTISVLSFLTPLPLTCLITLSLSHLMYKSSSPLFFLLSSVFHQPLSCLFVALISAWFWPLIIEIGIELYVSNRLIRFSDRGNMYPANITFQYRGSKYQCDSSHVCDRCNFR